jgi:cell division control protein 24
LYQELRDKGDLDQQRKEDISSGIIAAQAVLERTNAAIDREDRMEAVEELKTLVEDWKGHRIEGFGELLLYGQYTVLKGDGMGGKNEERDVSLSSRYLQRPFHQPGSPKFANEQCVQYKIYLFEMILLCCKELSANKAKKMNKSLITKTGKARLQLKGRIFMQNVTETVSLQKPGKTA